MSNSLKNKSSESKIVRGNIARSPIVEFLRLLPNKLLTKFGYKVSTLINRISVEDYISLYGKKAVDERRFYNIGSGTFRHIAWTNIDHKTDWYKDNVVDIDVDLLANKPIPLENSSAYAIYTAHTIEHITDKSAENMFSEVYRILKKKGYFRVVVPDIDLTYRAYKESDKYYFYWRNEPGWKGVSIPQLFLAFFASQTSMSPMNKNINTKKITDAELARIFKEKAYEDALNYCCSFCKVAIQKIRAGDHMNWWNEKKLISKLKRAGFKSVYKSGYGQSFCPILTDTNYFDNTKPRISLHIEARK